MTKIAPGVWYDGTTEDAATFYAATFRDSRATCDPQRAGRFSERPTR